MATARNATIQVRLTGQQKERAILAMQNSGYRCMSNFIRAIVLGHDLTSQKMILEIHQRIVGGRNEIKK